MSQWQQKIVAQLLMNRYFPAETCGKYGEVKIAFTLDRAGRLLSSKVISGPGFRALDNTALEIVNRSQPFPPAPPDATADDLKFSVPFAFAKPDRPISSDALSRGEKFLGTTPSICRGC
jgi:periplasmic protein TonB